MYMEALEEARDLTKSSYMTHVFSTTEDSKAEVLNTLQYAMLAIVPIVVLNKLIQRFVPEADLDKSSLELLAEIVAQIVVMFCGIIIIHRTITYLPTYSGYKYEALVLTNSILAFTIIMLSIQSKLGLKVNILYDRAMELWDGPSRDDEGPRSGSKTRKQVRFQEGATTQDEAYMEGPPGPIRGGMLPPPQMSNAAVPPAPSDGYMMQPQGPMPANAFGGSFGSLF